MFWKQSLLDTKFHKLTHLKKEALDWIQFKSNASFLYFNFI